MFKEIVIGTGIKGNTAIGITGYYSGSPSISQNRNCFWISSLYLGISMTVFKDTPEGIELADMISKEKPLEEISDFLNPLALGYVGTDELEQRIKRALKESYNQGYRDKASEIRVALGFSS